MNDEFLITGYFVLAALLGFVCFRWITKNHSDNDTKNTSIYHQ